MGLVPTGGKAMQVKPYLVLYDLMIYIVYKVIDRNRC